MGEKGQKSTSNKRRIKKKSSAKNQGKKKTSQATKIIDR